METLSFLLENAISDLHQQYQKRFNYLSELVIKSLSRIIESCDRPDLSPDLGYFCSDSFKKSLLRAVNDEQEAYIMRLLKNNSLLKIQLQLVEDRVGDIDKFLSAPIQNRQQRAHKTQYSKPIVWPDNQLDQKDSCGVSTTLTSMGTMVSDHDRIAEQSHTRQCKSQLYLKSVKSQSALGLGQPLLLRTHKNISGDQSRSNENVHPQSSKKYSVLQISEEPQRRIHTEAEVYAAPTKLKTPTSGTYKGFQPHQFQFERQKRVSIPTLTGSSSIKYVGSNQILIGLKNGLNQSNYMKKKSKIQISNNINLLHLETNDARLQTASSVTKLHDSSQQYLHRLRENKEKNKEQQHFVPSKIPLESSDRKSRQNFNQNNGKKDKYPVIPMLNLAHLA